jgi:hypothetical protein
MFLEAWQGSCSSSSHGGPNSPCQRRTQRVLVEGLVVLKGDLTVSTESVESLSVLEGEKEGSGSIPARQTAGKTIGGRVLLRLNAKVCGFR